MGNVSIAEERKVAFAAACAELKAVADMDYTERAQYWEVHAQQQREVRVRMNNFTSIAGVSDAIRLPRIGKIHLGIKKVSASGKEYPSQTDYFVVAPSDTTPELAVEAFRSTYGENPKEIKIMFPLNDREQFFPQAYKRYSGAGLECKGNGVQSVATVNGKLVEQACDPESCPHFQNKKCQLRGHLSVLLPDLPGLGIWQIDTGSFNSIRNINSAIEFIKALTGGRIAMIPLVLTIRPHKGRDPKSGAPTNNYVLDIASNQIKMTDVLTASQMTPAALLMPAVDYDAEDGEFLGRSIPDVDPCEPMPGPGVEVLPPVTGPPTDKGKKANGNFCSECGVEVLKSQHAKTTQFYGKDYCPKCEPQKEGLLS